MNRSNYFNYIDKKLSFLVWHIEKRGKINLLDLNIYSETFFADMLNILLGYNLSNLNVIKQNIEGIDLVDLDKKIIAQVSSTCTRQKIESSLEKEILKQYDGYCFKFIALSKNVDKLKKVSFANPYKVVFNPFNDIIDITSIQNMVLNMTICKQKTFYEFIKKELGDDINIVKVDSNLSTILNILASENLSNGIDSPEINSFKIDNKIEFNNLVSIKDTIDEYKIYYSKLNEKYMEFDKQGVNKSLSIFRIIKMQYTKLLAKGKTSSDLFFAIIDSIIMIIKESKNYIEIPYEELEMCVYILVVDTFVRCKIFKNPEGYSHVVTR